MPGLKGVSASAGLSTTTANRSQVQSRGNSFLPLWPLPSMLPLECRRMKRLWRLHHKAHSPFPASTGVNRSQVQPPGSSSLPLMSLTSMFPFECMRMYRLWISDQKAISPFPASTTWNRSQVQSEGSSSLPLWPLPSMFPFEFIRMNLLWILECIATTAPGWKGFTAGGGGGAAAPGFCTTTTANRSHVQPLGNSSLPLWPLPSMLPLSRKRMKRLWCLHHKAHSPFPASTGVNRSHVQPLGSSCLPLMSLTSMFPFACMRMYRLWISDQNAISPFPASTTWNLSQVQSEGRRASISQKSLPNGLTFLVEDASDSECENEFDSPWRNRRPSPGQWMEPVEALEALHE